MGVRGLVFSLVVRFFKTHGGYKYFTYRSLRGFYFRELRNGRYREWNADWHSVEREIRRLAEEGVWLRRVFVGKNKVRFYPTEKMWKRIRGEYV